MDEPKNIESLEIGLDEYVEVKVLIWKLSLSSESAKLIWKSHTNNLHHEISSTEASASKKLTVNPPQMDLWWARLFYFE